jgi:hypothetical protein
MIHVTQNFLTVLGINKHTVCNISDMNVPLTITHIHIQTDNM